MWGSSATTLYVEGNHVNQASYFVALKISYAIVGSPLPIRNGEGPSHQLDLLISTLVVTSPRSDWSYELMLIPHPEDRRFILRHNTPCVHGRQKHSMNQLLSCWAEVCLQLESISPPAFQSSFGIGFRRPRARLIFFEQAIRLLLPTFSYLSPCPLLPSHHCTPKINVNTELRVAHTHQLLAASQRTNASSKLPLKSA